MQFYRAAYFSRRRNIAVAACRLFGPFPEAIDTSNEFMDNALHAVIILEICRFWQCLFGDICDIYSSINVPR